MVVPKVPYIEMDLVREFVGAAHNDFEKMQEMLEKDPGLANAAADVGGGAYETALGGASHVGRRDIAEHLLANGARLDIFCAAMMGKVAIVQAFLDDDPDVAHLRGPHGIPLIKHAERGGQDTIVKLLESYGASV